MAQATRQHGVISAAELRRFGLTEKAIRWRVETGILQPLFVGVFLVGGSPRTWEQRITAAVRWGGDGAVASYKSAAALWGFDGFELNTNIADLQNQCAGESRWAGSIPSASANGL
ncbi:MAG: hypothetical protein JWM17_2441 [Actinobacteria bacterium]|nr:hypothetical protein [Actinomycetota bacterium]